tara:strand:- start:20343 stop:21284 length:942 start_codon:yes stop_codon:yes gene_type:complete
LNEKAINTTSAVSNTIRVSQGDGDGVGLEVFLKSAILLGQSEVEKLHLYSNKETLKRVLSALRIPFSLTQDKVNISNLSIHTSWSKGDAFECFEAAIKDLSGKDVLFTLPASKKSFPSGAPGHTAYLRQRFGRDLIMFFKSNEQHIGLLTDHIQLSKVSETITPDLIFNTTKAMLIGAKSFLNLSPKKVLFSGINPHAGESGILGNDFDIYAPAIKRLASTFSDIQFTGPLAGDTLYNKADKDTWLIFAHHDQALAPFKAMRSFNGANITLGLDFLRLSVDHGTAIDIAGQDKANYLGCIYCLQLALKALENS